MNLDKFAGMLMNEGIWFSSPDEFKKEDPFEGSIPRLWSKRQTLETRALNKEKALLAGPTKATRERLNEDKTGVLVNCWHISEYESLAMWKLYAGGSGSVCIQSTCGRIRKLPVSSGPGQIHVGSVRYFDYANDDLEVGQALAPYMCKRHSFEHEKELRAIWYVDPESKSKLSPGYLRVNLNDLIEKVFISPSTLKRNWVQQVVQDIAQRYKLRASVLRSEMDSRALR